MPVRWKIKAFNTYPCCFIEQKNRCSALVGFRKRLDLILMIELRSSQLIPNSTLQLPICPSNKKETKIIDTRCMFWTTNIFCIKCLLYILRNQVLLLYEEKRTNSGNMEWNKAVDRSVWFQSCYLVSQKTFQEHITLDPKSVTPYKHALCIHSL